MTPTAWLSTKLRLPRTTTIVHGLRVSAKRELTQPSASPLTFLFLGRLVSTKGVRILFAAAEKLKDQRCAVRVKIIRGGPGLDLPAEESITGRA